MMYQEVPGLRQWCWHEAQPGASRSIDLPELLVVFNAFAIMQLLHHPVRPLVCLPEWLPRGRSDFRGRRVVYL